MMAVKYRSIEWYLYIVNAVHRFSGISAITRYTSQPYTGRKTIQQNIVNLNFTYTSIFYIVMYLPMYILIIINYNCLKLYYLHNRYIIIIMTTAYFELCSYVALCIYYDYTLFIFLRKIWICLLTTFTQQTWWKLNNIYLFKII